jgi:cysteine desulfurase/selenocysteine lyase
MSGAVTGVGTVPLVDPHPPTRLPTPPIDVERIRQDFPLLQQRIRGKPLVYLDNAATSQKPQSVIDAVTRFYTSENANIHRGVHYLSERATDAYDQVRQ